MSLSDEIYTNFGGVITEVQNLSKDTRAKVEEYRQRVSQGADSHSLEDTIKKNIDAMNAKYNKLENGYSNRNAPSGIPGGELDRRQKEIQSLKNTINQVAELYRLTENQKYSYKVSDKFSGPYQQTDEMKNMSNNELMNAQKEKIKQQDRQMEEIANEAVKGQKIAREIKHELVDQNKQLDEMQKDFDKLDSRMNRLTKRFENYVAKQSGCKIIITLVIEAAIAGAMWIILF